MKLIASILAHLLAEDGRVIAILGVKIRENDVSSTDIVILKQCARSCVDQRRPATRAFTTWRATKAMLGGIGILNPMYRALEDAQDSQPIYLYRKKSL